MGAHLNELIAAYTKATLRYCDGFIATLEAGSCDTNRYTNATCNGFIVPHIVRFFVGVDYRHILPFSALFGALFLSMCDLLSRYVNAPFETPIGVVTACIGVPCFLYLIRRKGGEKNAA